MLPKIPTYLPGFLMDSAHWKNLWRPQAASYAANFKGLVFTGVERSHLILNPLRLGV